MRTHHVPVLAWMIAMAAADASTCYAQARYGEVDATNYESFDAAVTAIGSAVKTLVVHSDTVVSTAVTVPPTLHVRVTGGGQFTHAGSGKITFQGPLEAPLLQVFSGFPTGEIGFADGSVTEVYPNGGGQKATKNPMIHSRFRLQ